VTVDWLWWLQVAFILYFLLLNGMYLLLNLLSMGSLMGYIRQRAETGELAPYLGVEPPVSVLMPAFNEEATIRTSVRSMLQLQYPEFEIVVINDGSKDRTLAVLIEEFDLVPHPEPLRQAVAHQPVQAIYRSRRYANLRVVDKANGGKADALNAVSMPRATDCSVASTPTPSCSATACCAWSSPSSRTSAPLPRAARCASPTARKCVAAS